jgi:hypothetical protein
VVFRSSIERDLETPAEIVGSNSTAALSFGDQNAAAELLSTLCVKTPELQPTFGLTGDSSDK